MPAKSKAQQRFFGMVHAYQKGELENPSKSIIDAADSISKKDAKKFASTKHKGLPNHVKKSKKKKMKKINETVLQNIIKESIMNTLRDRFNPEINGFYGRKVHDGEPKSLKDVFESDGWRAIKMEPMKNYLKVIKPVKLDASLSSNSIPFDDLLEDVNIYCEKLGWFGEKIENGEWPLIGFKRRLGNGGIEPVDLTDAALRKMIRESMNEISSDMIQRARDKFSDKYGSWLNNGTAGELKRDLFGNPLHPKDNKPLADHYRKFDNAYKAAKQDEYFEENPEAREWYNKTAEEKLEYLVNEMGADYKELAGVDEEVLDEIWEDMAPQTTGDVNEMADDNGEYVEPFDSDGRGDFDLDYNEDEPENTDTFGKFIGCLEDCGWAYHGFKDLPDGRTAYLCNKEIGGNNQMEWEQVKQTLKSCLGDKVAFGTSKSEYAPEQVKPVVVLNEE